MPASLFGLGAVLLFLLRTGNGLYSDLGAFYNVFRNIPYCICDCRKYWCKKAHNMSNILCNCWNILFLSVFHQNLLCLTRQPTMVMFSTRMIFIYTCRRQQKILEYFWLKLPKSDFVYHSEIRYCVLLSEKHAVWLFCIAIYIITYLYFSKVWMQKCVITRNDVIDYFRHA